MTTSRTGDPIKDMVAQIDAMRQDPGMLMGSIIELCREADQLAADISGELERRGPPVTTVERIRFQAMQEVAQAAVQLSGVVTGALMSAGGNLARLDAQEAASLRAALKGPRARPVVVREKLSD